jgi:hypothetical protein
VAATAALASAQSSDQPVQGAPAKLPSSAAFTGASLASTRAGVTFDGSAFVRIKCPSHIFGFCYGRVTLTQGSTKLGSAPLGLRSRDAPAVKVPLSRSARARARSGGLTATATIVSEDGLGHRVARHGSLRLARG